MLNQIFLCSALLKNIIVIKENTLLEINSESKIRIN